MYYLQCGHCAEYSALKSEYITFCDNCGRKLPVSYSDWKISHPEMDFDAFLVENAIPGEEYVRLMRKRNRDRFDMKKKAALITGIVLLGAFSAIGAWYGPSIVRMFREPAVSAVLLENSQWRTFRGNVIRVQTPLSLSPVNSADSPNMRLKSFRGGSRAEGLVIQMQEAIYLSDAHIDLKPAADAIATTLSKLPNVSRFRINEQALDLAGEPAVWQHGSYVYQQTSEMEFNSLVVVRGGTRVQVLVTHRGNDKTGREVAEKVMRSARLN